MDNAAASSVGETLEAIFLVPFLRPMIAGMNGIGDYELDLLARDLAAHDASGFGRLVAAGLEAHR